MGLRDKIVMLIPEYWDFIGNVSFCQRLKPSLSYIHHPTQITMWF